MDSRRVIDILESREVDDVTEWLSGYSGIEIVSRDGSLKYGSAIRQAHPEALQVSDRFHLIKNIADAAKKHIAKAVGSRFWVSGIGDSYKGDYWNTTTASEPILFIRRHITATEKKKKIVDQVRRLTVSGNSVPIIASTLGICRRTVKKYQNKDYSPEKKDFGAKRSGKVHPYTQTIDSMLGKGCQFKEIEHAIRKMGYVGTADAIRMYASRQRHLLQTLTNRRLEKSGLIERKWITKLLYQPLEKVKEITVEQLERVIKEYPVIAVLYNIVGSFKETLFSKNPENLGAWVETAASLGIEEVNGFINGVRRDLDAVKNAIQFDYSNGLAEGKINKLKLIKRIMYGRCSFRLLRNKLLLGEYFSSFN